MEGNRRLYHCLPGEKVRLIKTFYAQGGAWSNMHFKECSGCGGENGGGGVGGQMEGQEVRMEVGRPV